MQWRRYRGLSLPGHGTGKIPALIFLSDYLKKSFRLGDITEKGITFWSMIYIPIVVAMASKQNVLGALDGGLIAILSGGIAVLLSFLLIPVLSKIKK